MDNIFRINWRARISLILTVVLAVAAFSSLAVNVASGQEATDPSASQMTSFSSGALVNDGGTIYLIRGLTKIPFTNMGAFIGLGYSTKNVVKGDTSNYPLANYNIASASTVHPWGSWLSYNGTVYYSTSGGMIGVPDEATFTANGGNFNYVLPANDYDIAALNANPDVPPLTDNDPRIYSQNPAPAPAPMTLNFGTPTDNSGATLNFGTPPPDNATTTMNVGSSPTATSTVGNGTGYPSIPAIAIPAGVMPNVPVTVTASSTDPSNLPLTYTFNWGDSSTSTSAAVGSATHTYVAAGNYSLSVSVSDGNLTNYSVTTVTVGTPTAPASAPVIGSLTTTSAPIGATIGITGSGFTDSNNAILSINTASNTVLSLATGVTSSASGTSLTFLIPTGSVSNCPMSGSCQQTFISPGSYPIAVVNSNGTSTSVSFTVTP